MSYEPGDVAEGFELKNANESIGGGMVTLDSVLTKSGAVVLFECNHCPYVVAVSTVLIEPQKKQTNSEWVL